MLDPNAENLLEDCENVINIPKSRGGPGYTRLDKKFICQMRKLASNGKKATEEQLGMLEDLWGEI